MKSDRERIRKQTRGGGRNWINLKKKKSESWNLRGNKEKEKKSADDQTQTEKIKDV